LKRFLVDEDEVGGAKGRFAFRCRVQLLPGSEKLANAVIELVRVDKLVQRAGSSMAAEPRSQLASGRLDSSAAKVRRIVVLLLSSYVGGRELALLEGLEEGGGDGGANRVALPFEEVILVNVDGVEEACPASPRTVGLIGVVLCESVKDSGFGRRVDKAQEARSSGRGTIRKLGVICEGKWEKR
jgi:hypothetical protein